MPYKKIEKLRKKVQQKKKSKRAKRRARSRRIERNEPKGGIETVQATVNQTQKLAGEVGITSENVSKAAGSGASLLAPPEPEEMSGNESAERRPQLPMFGGPMDEPDDDRGDRRMGGGAQLPKSGFGGLGFAEEDRDDDSGPSLPRF